MGRDRKRQRKVLRKGARTLEKISREHTAKAPHMKTPESRSYALKEAELFRRQSREKSDKYKKLGKKRR
jgi:hypothetical protein